MGVQGQLGIGAQVAVGAGTFAATAFAVGVPTTEWIVARHGVPENGRHQRGWADTDTAGIGGAAVGFTVALGGVLLVGARGASGGAARKLGGVAIGSALGGGLTGAIGGGVVGKFRSNSIDREWPDPAASARVREHLNEQPGIATGLEFRGAGVLARDGALLFPLAVAAGGLAGSYLRKVPSQSGARLAAGIVGATIGAAGAGAAYLQYAARHTAAGVFRPMPEGTVPELPVSTDLDATPIALPTGTALTLTEAPRAGSGGSAQPIDLTYDRQVGLPSGYDSRFEAEVAAQQLTQTASDSNQYVPIAVIENAGRWYLAALSVPQSGDQITAVVAAKDGPKVARYDSEKWQYSPITHMTNADGSTIRALVTGRYLVDLPDGSLAPGNTGAIAEVATGGQQPYEVDQMIDELARTPDDLGLSAGFADLETAAAVMRRLDGDQQIIRIEDFWAYRLERPSRDRYFVVPTNVDPPNTTTFQPSVPSGPNEVLAEIDGIEYMAHDGWWLTPGEITDASFSR